jgi:putative iron-only hydrogenase system regulator
MEKRLGFIGIIIEDRKKAAPEVNKILTEYGELIIARTGIPYPRRKCCVITLIVEGTNDELGAMTGKIGKVAGVAVKSALAKEPNNRSEQRE